jgi:hypothetical protein
MSVAVAFGSTSVTGIRQGRSSIRNASPIDSIAAFDAQYTPVHGVVTLPLSDDMMTTRP